MMSDKISGFWTPSPPCQHFEPISSTKITQPPLLRQILGNPLPPLSADVICECPLIASAVLPKILFYTLYTLKYLTLRIFTSFLGDFDCETSSSHVLNSYFACPIFSTVNFQNHDTLPFDLLLISQSLRVNMKRCP